MPVVEHVLDSIGCCPRKGSLLPRLEQFVWIHGKLPLNQSITDHNLAEKKFRQLADSFLGVTVGLLARHRVDHQDSSSHSRHENFIRRRCSRCPGSATASVAPIRAARAASRYARQTPRRDHSRVETLHARPPRAQPAARIPLQTSFWPHSEAP